jgi:hypothetical protein
MAWISCDMKIFRYVFLTLLFFFRLLFRLLFLIRHTFNFDTTDKAVKDSIKSGKKDPEPINQLLKNLGYHVDVPLKKPTQTVFSSMGGGRNVPSTKIGWGGPDDNKAKYDTPKDFVYREEDFPPPSSANYSYVTFKR